MFNYQFNIQYYISTGRLGVMYTLRYKAIESYPNGDGTFKERKLDVYLCTLSKDPEEALKKAKEYLAELGVDHTKHDLTTDFSLNERASCVYGAAAERRSQIADQLLVKGKYEGKHVSELPENYLKWYHGNVFTGVNHEIIENYIAENDLHNEWVASAALAIYNKLIDFKNKFQTHLDNFILEFGGKPKVQQIINKKSGEANQKTLDFLGEFIRNSIVKQYDDVLVDVEEEDDEYIIDGVDLVKYIQITRLNFVNCTYMNYIVARNTVNIMKKRKLKYVLLDFTYDDVLNMVKETESNEYMAIAFSINKFEQ